MHLVRQIKKFDDIHVANAVLGLGYQWPRRRPMNAETLLTGVPRCDLEKILQRLNAEHAKFADMVPWAIELSVAEQVREFDQILLRRQRKALP